ncbi:MAG: hypothetical protein RL404_829 [Pseudomonadota bacterium]|jgi:putative ABC transport system permease protein
MKETLRWLVAGEWRAHPGRVAVAVLAIAIGVALGFGIHLVNTAAFSEFSAAARSLSGSADLQLRARSASFDENLYADIAAMPSVAIASPVLELDLPLPGQRSPLKLVAIDSFQASGIAPDLLGVPADGDAMAALRADSVFLSPAAMDGLHLKPGDTLAVQSGTRSVPLRVAGTLLRSRAGQRLAVMDIGGAQWRFDRIGQLSRMDLRLTEGVDRLAVKSAIEQRYGNSVVVVEDHDQDQRTATLSRAYRVNLSVLAMVALFTGAFLVFSTQALSVLRRRPQFALLRTLGMTRRELLLQVMAEGTLLGVTGSAIGIALGYLLASGVLALFGGDLGGGYFPGVQPVAHVSPWAATGYFIAGSGVALLGSLSPALEAARARPAAALKAGSEEVALAPLASPWPALCAIVAGGVLAWLPPLSGLPVFGYLAIALLLVGSIALMPRAAAMMFAMLARRTASTAGMTATKGVMRELALARLANAPNQAAIALGGVLASFALMVAMAIMVASFRVSVDDWLQQLLSADVYVRIASGANSSTDAARLKPDEQQAIASLPAVARAERTRWLSLALDPSRPNVVLIARSINAGDPAQAMPLVGDSLKDLERPVWISEAMLDLYGWRVGQSVPLPLAGKSTMFTVAGVWRDYARQTGSIQMRLQDYQDITGDKDVNDLSLWLQRGRDDAATDPAGIRDFRRQWQRLPFAASLDVVEPSEIRAISLTIFDRSFAVTYLLEAVAIVIGMFGVAATFSAQALSRAKEFGMLRHLGMSRRQILGMLAGEGALLAALAISVGFLVGWCISLVLVFVVNPQSFHWTMALHMPWGLLAIVATALLLSAALTALVSGRMAVAGSAVRAVREDW